MPPLGSLRRATVAIAGATLLILPWCAGLAVPSPAAGTPVPPAPTRVSAASLVATRVKVPSALGRTPLDTPRTLRVPAGWTVSVWARPKKARLLAFAPDGRLLVSRPQYGIVTLLTPNKRGRPTSRTLLRSLRQPHGLAFDGSTLYVAESHRIDAYHYSKGKATGRRTVLGGLPDAQSNTLHGAYDHALKSVAVGPHHELYVSVGSTGNVSPEDRSASPQRATILRVPRGGKATVYARGVRNGTGLAVAPDGAVWTAVNNRDETAYPYDLDYTGDGRSDRGQVITGYVNDHPLEPLAKLRAGRDLGWPYCNPDPDVSPGAPGSALSYANRPFVRDVQTNANGAKLDCAKLPKVEQGLGAHSAPLGLSFTTAGLPAPYGKGALVGAHGSWNRHPPRAPEVAFFPLAGTGLGDQQTLVTGFQFANGSRWGRVVMALQGPDKAIYVSDDLADAVYRIAPPAR